MPHGWVHMRGCKDMFICAPYLIHILNFSLCDVWLIDLLISLFYFVLFLLLFIIPLFYLLLIYEFYWRSKGLQEMELFDANGLDNNAQNLHLWSNYQSFGLNIFHGES